MAGLLDDPTGYLRGLLGAGWDRFRGVDPATGEADYWKRGGMAGLLGMPSWDEQPKTDIAMGFAGSTTPAAKGLMKGIRAYHGSPHDFDKFDLSKIGTGEGAQAYGHGLYFAENEGVARSYRDALSKPELLLNGERIQAPDWKGLIKSGELQKMPRDQQIDLSARDMLAQMSHPKWGRTLDDEVASQALEARVLGNNSANAAEKAYWHDVARRLEEMGRELRVKDGKMYEVQINADPERFVDFDGAVDPRAKSVIDRELAPMIGASGLESFWKHAPPTNNAYTRAERALPRGHLSKAMVDAGIPGIKYLDQGSRAAGEGSRNYVVFDDSLISILRKYGLLGPMAGGATAGAVGDY